MMAEKYEKTDKVMVMTLEQLNEAENLIEVREAIGNAQNIAKDKWATLGSAIRHFSGLKLQ